MVESGEHQSQNATTKHRKKSRPNSSASTASVIYLGKIKKHVPVVVIEDNSNDEQPETYRSKLRKLRSHRLPYRKNKVPRQERTPELAISASW